MVAVRKQFSRALYEAYDAPARLALVSLLESKGHQIVNNEENYSVDVVSQKGEYTYFNEAEVKTGWKEDWPLEWKEIRIPDRCVQRRPAHFPRIDLWMQDCCCCVLLFSPHSR